MRHGPLKLICLAAVVTAAVVAAVLALATGGRAASKNICASPSPTQASCLIEVAAPHFLSPFDTAVGADAFSVTKFINESGNGGSTATHVVLTAGFSPAVTVKSITLSLDGTSLDTSGCSPAPSSLPQPTITTVTCPVANVAGGSKVKMTVFFTTFSSSGEMLSGTVSYGEGTGTSGNPVNSVQGNSDTISVGGSGFTLGAGGGCFQLKGSNKATVGGSETSNGITQGTQMSVGQGAGDIPCTFVDAGVLDVKVGKTSAIPLHTKIAFFESPTFVSGLGTLTMTFSKLPAGLPALGKIKFLEDTNYAPPYFSTFITIPPCDKSGNIPAPVGFPAQGATDAVAHSNDICELDTQPSAGGGTIIFLTIGSPPDQHIGT